ncbi:MAG: hypothetical protein MRERV_93c008, partial [Mycoplasmataceae bacterium RV_VA103A]
LLVLSSLFLLCFFRESFLAHFSKTSLAFSKK